MGGEGVWGMLCARERWRGCEMLQLSGVEVRCTEADATRQGVWWWSVLGWVTKGLVLGARGAMSFV